MNKTTHSPEAPVALSAIDLADVVGGIIAHSDGAYRLQVRALEAKDSGRYGISLGSTTKTTRRRVQSSPARHTRRSTPPMRNVSMTCSLGSRSPMHRRWSSAQAM